MHAVARFHWFLGSLTMLVLLAAGPARADVIPWVATLSGASEVPPNVGLGTGQAAGTIDTDTNVVTWQIAYFNLSGVPVAAHFHLAPVGVNGPVIIPITVGPSPLVGSGPILPAHVQPFLTGGVYVNIHTAAFPGGEIRGQVVLLPPVSAPAMSFLSLALAVGLLVLVSLVALRRRGSADAT